MSAIKSLYCICSKMELETGEKWEELILFLYPNTPGFVTGR